MQSLEKHNINYQSKSVESAKAPPLFDFAITKAAIRGECFFYLKGIDESFLSNFFQGKMIRSLVLFLLGENLKINSSDLLKFAASIELMHEASLVHDDIEDKQEMRRDHYTTWVSHGLNQAINIGDYLLNIGSEPLFDLKAHDPLTAIKVYNAIVKNVLQGQILEQNSVGKVISESDYYRFIEFKTGTLLKAPLYFIKEHFTTKDYEHVSRSLSHLACAYQLENDRQDFLLKEEGNDFQNNIPTLPFIMLYKGSNLFKINNRNSARLFNKKDITFIDTSIKKKISKELDKFKYYLNQYSHNTTTQMELIFSKYFKGD